MKLVLNPQLFQFQGGAGRTKWKGLFRVRVGTADSLI